MVQIWYGVGKCKYNLVQKNIISELILMKINFLLIHRQDLVRKPYPWSKSQNGHNDNFGKILVKKSIFLIIVKICVRYRDILVDVQAKLGLKTKQQAPLPIMQTVAPYSPALQRLAEGLLREKKVFSSYSAPSTTPRERCLKPLPSFVIDIKIHHQSEVSSFTTIQSKLSSDVWLDCSGSRLHDTTVEDEGGIGRLGWAIRGSSSDCPDGPGSARSNSGRHPPFLASSSPLLLPFLENHSLAWTRSSSVWAGLNSGCHSPPLAPLSGFMKKQVRAHFLGLG